MYPYFKTTQNQVCSRGCVHKWTNFGQNPPKWQICDCCAKNNKKHVYINYCIKAA